MTVPTDRRLLRSNGRVAHVALKGQVEADRFAEPVAASVAWSALTLWNTPGGRIERTLTFGDVFHILEDGPFAFGYSAHDGFVGYVESRALWRDAPPATHRVAVRESIGLGEPDFKTKSEHLGLSLGSSLHVVDEAAKWAEFVTMMGKRMWVPRVHLSASTAPEPDPVAVAERLLGTPYQWGGNTAHGIDCSGLVQMACRMCNIPCPGDSDLQQAHFPVAPTRDHRRGDLVFWKGHVAWVSDPDTLLHANAHHMAVAYEPVSVAVARILSQGDGPVTHHARPDLAEARR